MAESDWLGVMILSINDILQLDSIEIFNLVKNNLDSFYDEYNNITIGKEEFYKIAINEIDGIKNANKNSDVDFVSTLLKRIDLVIKKEKELLADPRYKTLISDVEKYPLLSQEEMMELITKSQNGDKESKEKLIKHNMRLVISLAKKFIGLGIDFEDLIQEGTIGLLRAIDKFDVNKNIRFSTYVMYWIKCYLHKAIYFDSRTIRIPSNKYEEIYEYKRTHKKLFEELNREPTIEEIAGKMGISYDKCLQLYYLQYDIISLNKKINNDESEDSEFGDFVESDENVENESIQGFIKEDVKEALYNSGLTEKEIYVLIHKYGLFNNKRMNFAQIGREINLSRERISKIEKNALLKLKNSKSSRKLMYYIYENMNKNKNETNSIEEYYDINFNISDKDNPIRDNIYEISNDLRKEKKMHISKETVYQLIGCTNDELNTVIYLLTEEESSLLKKRKSNSYKLIMTKEEKDEFNNVLLPKLRKIIKDSKDYKKNSLKNGEEYTNLCETIENAKDNRDKELLSIIEKIIDTKVFKELNKIYSIKESIAIILLNGYIYDSCYSADYVSCLLDIPIKRVFEIYKQSIILLKYIKYDDIEKVKELSKK